MIEYPFVVLPDDFTFLLKENMQSASKGFTGLKTYVLERRDISRLVQKGFVDIDSEGRVERIIKAVGWFGMRNRLANIYLTKALTQKFPEKPPLDFLSDINKFEEQFRPFSVEGHSRSFLLGLYLRYCLVELKGTGADIDINEFFNTQQLKSLLKIGGKRVIKIDWLLLILHHFLIFLGPEVCEQQLKKKVGFDTLWQQLSDDECSLMTANLLSYGASILEPDLFTSDFIK